MVRSPGRPVVSPHRRAVFSGSLSPKKPPGSSKPEARNPKKIERSQPRRIELPQARGEDVHQLRRLLDEFTASDFRRRVGPGIDEPEPVAGLLRLLAGDPHPHDSVLRAERLVRLDVVRPDRSRRPDQLLAVLDVPDRARQRLDEHPHPLGEQERSLFEIVHLPVLLTGHGCLRMSSFRISYFEFRAYSAPGPIIFSGRTISSYFSPVSTPLPSTNFGAILTASSRSVVPFL